MSQSRPRTGAPQRRPAQPAARPSQSQARRPAQPQRGPGRSYRSATGTGGGFKADLVKVVVGGVIVAVLALLLQNIWPDGFPVGNNQNFSGTAAAITEIHSSGPVRLNEIMSANSRTITNEKNESSDWFEVINVSDKPVNLAGYEVAKTANATNVFTFPDMTLQPKECALIFADSKLRNTAGEELHAPFRISSAGDTLMLFNAAGTAVDTVNVPRLNSDAAYIRKSTDVWEVGTAVTPEMENTQENAELLTQTVADSPVLVMEISAAGQHSIADENGEYADYIILKNVSSSPVDMSGWYISDNERDIRKWRFPAITIEAGETITVFASGKDRSAEKDKLHTNFGLSSEGEIVVLSDPKGRRMDRVDYGLMKRDAVWSR